MNYLCVAAVLLLAAQALVAAPLQLTVQRDGQTLATWQVELADTVEERARGLMWRESLAAGTGMLFDFGGETEILMWMKNTLIPLDMLFVDSHGLIVDIRHDARPHSLEVIRSKRPARYTVEVNGGDCRRLGIKPGDRIVGLPLRR